MAMSSIAQNDTSSYYKEKNKAGNASANPFHTDITMGAGISFSNLNRTSTFTYIAPTLQYQLNKKFAVSAGLIHYSVTGNPFISKGSSENSFMNRNQTYSGNIIQLGGLYQLNDRVRLSGSVLYKAPSVTNQKQTNFNSTSLGLDYKVNPSTTISIRTTVTQGTNLNSPYYSPVYEPFQVPTNSNVATRPGYFPH